uniref:non-specific serine/threonine protein kinase n=1 Tax=Setaria italica TaxID=4555 RepID=K3YSQ5_SETIT
MGNICGGSGKADVAEDFRPSSPGTTMTSSKTSGSITTSQSTTGKLSSVGSSFMASAGSRSTGSGFDEGGKYLDGQILEAPNLRTFTFMELKAATKNFRPDSVLGEGGFGRVYKGWVDEKTMAPTKNGTGMVVAVKKLNSESMQGYEEWQSEINFLGRLSHPNLVKLLGYCFEDKELLLLFRRGCAPLSWELRLKIAIGAARGLAFLHASEKQVIYRDFKASNILLDANYNAKLSDFGLAKLGPTGSNSHITTRVMGTYGYAAPEYVATGHLYVKSDVYGFGVVMLEMLSGQRALDPNRPNGQLSLADWAKPYLADRRRLARLMDPRFEGQYNSKQAFQAAQLTLNCLAGEPRSRPSMKEVVETLEQIESMKSRAREARGGGSGSSRDRHHGRSAAAHQRSSPRAGGEPRGRGGSRAANGHAAKAR